VGDRLRTYRSVERISVFDSRPALREPVKALRTRSGGGERKAKRRDRDYLPGGARRFYLVDASCARSWGAEPESGAREPRKSCAVQSASRQATNST